jgi:hypothetical protein
VLFCLQIGLFQRFGEVAMLAVADRRRGFFDAAWCSGLLPEDSF